MKKTKMSGFEIRVTEPCCEKKSKFEEDYQRMHRFGVELKIRQLSLLPH